VARGPTADDAATLLSEDFVGITRANGKERTRDGLLADIAHPAKPALRRELEDLTILWRSSDLAVARSTVATTDAGDPNAGRRRFRNLHVLRLEEGRWRCLAWQVTERERLVDG
jgi:hypothetical protein